MTVGMRARTKFDSKKVRFKAKQANIKNLGHAGATIRLTARRSIRRRKKKSAVGKPPSTRTGRLKKAIVYKVEKQHDRVLVGPEHSIVGKAGSAHEHGGRYKKQRYKKRPFMGPALEKTKERLPRKWGGSVR